MKIILGALAALVLSLAEAATDGALRGKRQGPPTGLLRYNVKAKDQDNKSSELMNTSLPTFAKANLEKIADALCSVDESPDLHYVVKFADKIWNCDEEATGMIANSATTAVAENLALQSHPNHNGLAVEGKEQVGEEVLPLVIGGLQIISIFW
jgi:hypothetical protein